MIIHVKINICVLYEFCLFKFIVKFFWMCKTSFNLTLFNSTSADICNVFTRAISELKSTGHILSFEGKNMRIDFNRKSFADQKQQI